MNLVEKLAFKISKDISAEAEVLASLMSEIAERNNLELLTYYHRDPFKVGYLMDGDFDGFNDMTIYEVLDRKFLGKYRRPVNSFILASGNEKYLEILVTLED